MIKQADAVKIYKRRDSATAALRKLGTPQKMYSEFIGITDDGQFECRIGYAKAYLENRNKSTKPKVVKTTKRQIKERNLTVEGALKVPKEKKVTISSMCRALILDGKSNAEILEALRDEFGEERIGPEKSSYPCWYRCELRRKGELPPAFETSARLGDNTIHKFED